MALEASLLSDTAPEERSAARTAFALLLGLGVCAAVWLEVWVWHGGLLRVSLRIGGGYGFPIPLIYWAAVAVYAWVYGEQIGRAVRLGFWLHIVALLATVAWQMSRPLDVPLSGWYIRYWQAVWAGVLALGAARVWPFVEGWRKARAADPHLFFVPLLIGYAAFWGLSLTLSPVVTGIGTVGGVALLIGRRVDAVRKLAARVQALTAEERWFLSAIFLGSIAFRLFYMTRVMSTPDFLNTGSDGAAYDALAWALVKGVSEPRWENIPMFAPGYVRFLALLYWIGGRSYAFVCVVQSVFGALAGLLMYDVAKRLFGRAVARITAVFGMLNFPMIFAAVAIGHQAMDLFWTLLVVWCCVRYLDHLRRGGRWMLGIGLLTGWATATREGNGVFWMFLVAWILLWVRARVGWRSALLHAAALSAGFFIVLAPFLGRGSVSPRIAEHWFLSFSYTGVNVNQWFNPWRDPAGAMALFKSQPLNVVMTLGRAVIANFNVMFLNQDYGSFDPVFLLRLSIYSFGLWGYAYLCAFTGLVFVAWKAMRAPANYLGWWLIVGVVFSRALPHLLLQAAYRYRVPLEPFLIMLAAVGLTQLSAMGRPRHSD